MSGQSGTPRVLLVWDAPNMDMGLGAILGGRPTAAHRPRFDALGRWLLQRTADISATAATGTSVEPEATVFTNIVPGSADVVRPWVDALRNVGYAVFAKPKLADDSDVDSDMLDP
ncbi:MAG: NYN domain-containing protein, partial [Mycobacterium sp.]|nr:NYN domain-containing protein [Mycobacterium sp.]